MAGQSRTVVTLIAVFKLVKGTLLLAASLGVIDLLGKDPAATVTTWLGELGIDPRRGFIHATLGELGSFSVGQLEAIAVGGLLYAAVFFVEGIGLLRRRRWAEYLTIAITISFIPFEIYELVHAASIVKIATLIVNIAIAAYLIVRVKRG